MTFLISCFLFYAHSRKNAITITTEAVATTNRNNDDDDNNMTGDFVLFIAAFILQITVSQKGFYISREIESDPQCCAESVSSYLCLL